MSRLVVAGTHNTLSDALSSALRRNVVNACEDVHSALNGASYQHREIFDAIRLTIERQCEGNTKLFEQCVIEYLLKHVYHNNPQLLREQLIHGNPLLTTDPVVTLPPELVLHIFTFLDVKDLLTACTVSHSWGTIARDDAIWRQKYEERYGQNHSRFHQPITEDGWKYSYFCRVRADNNWRAGKCFRERILDQSSGAVVHFHQQANRLVTGSMDKAIRIFEFGGAYRLLCTLHGHRDTVSKTLFLENTQCMRVVSASWDGTIKLWALNGTPAADVAPLPSQGGVDHVDTPCDDDIGGGVLHIASAALSPMSTLSGRCVRTLEDHDGKVWVVQPFGNELFSGGTGDAKLRAWDMESGRVKQRIGGHSGSIRYLLVDRIGPANAPVIVTASYDSTVRFFDTRVSSGACFATLCGHNSSVYSLNYIPGNNTLVSGDCEGELRQWDVRKWVFLWQHRDHKAAVNWLALRSDAGGKASLGMLVTGSDDRSIAVVDIAKRKRLYSIRPGNWVNCVQSEDRGSRLISATHSQVIVWNFDMSCASSETLNAVVTTREPEK